tara:strand:- start:660 stop:1031 length:372 start_codon:yes stop_codon:yes gene_type:complete
MTQTELFEHALKARKFAKAKYSNYKVGAAILCENGEIIYGCNVESKAYPTTMCAERVAIFSAISQGITNFKSIAVVTKDGAAPCGGCRQVMFEYAGDIPVIIGDLNGIQQCINLSDLLPLPFA